MSVYRYNVASEVRTVNINRLMQRRGMTKYKLSKISGVPHTTINDICSGKTKLEKCSAETLFKLSKALCTSMESLLMDDSITDSFYSYRSTFDVFKSDVCHRVKNMGDIDFIINVLESGQIRIYYDKRWYLESFYLLAMVDYLSRENGLPRCLEYDDIRSKKLAEPLFPLSVFMADIATNNSRWKTESMRAAIPEFLRFNIVESEVRNVI